MRISKEKMFRIGYVPVLDKKNADKKKRTSHIMNFIRQNKIITLSVIIFFMCVMLNLVLIYNFIKILENV